MATRPMNRIFRLYVDPKNPKRAVASIDGAPLNGLRSVEVSAGGDAMPIVRLELMVTEVDLQVPDPVIESLAHQRRCEFCRGLVEASDSATREHVKICPRHPMRATERLLGETEQLLGETKRREEAAKNECGKLSKRIVDLEADCAVLTMHAMATAPKGHQQPTITVHRLSAGIAACGFRQGPPAEWPAGHVWESGSPPPEASGCRNCPDCWKGVESEPPCAKCKCPAHAHEDPPPLKVRQVRGACHAREGIDPAWDDGEGGCSCTGYEAPGPKVHLLVDGAPQCRFTKALLADWPPGHMATNEAAQMNCPECSTEFRRAPTQVDDLTDAVREQLGDQAPAKVEVVHTDPGARGKLTHFELRLSPAAGLGPNADAVQLPVIEVVERDGRPVARVKPRDVIDPKALQLRVGTVLEVQELGGAVVPPAVAAEVLDLVKVPRVLRGGERTIALTPCARCGHLVHDPNPCPQGDYQSKCDCAGVAPVAKCEECPHPRHGNSPCAQRETSDLGKVHGESVCNCLGPAPILF